MNRRRPSPPFSDGPWLVVSAFAPELAWLRAARARLVHGGPRVVLGTVGVGLVEAAAGTSRLLAAHQPNAVLLLGTAGVYPGHRHALPVGSAAVVAETVLLPTGRPGRDFFWPSLMPDRQPASSGLLRHLVRATQLPTADVACPVAISATARIARMAARRSGCALENLEAFAVARAAAAARVPFGAIVGIANLVGPSGHRAWKRHARSAATAACQAALAFIMASGRRA